MEQPIASLIVRGQVIESDLVPFSGRGDELSFLVPDPNKYASTNIIK